MRRIVLLASLTLASAAQADTTAIYANPAGRCSMIARIASNGDLRGEMKGNSPGVVTDRTYYFVGGKDYFADQTGSGVIVMRLDDMIQVMAEQFAELSSKMGIPSFSPPPINFVRKGTVSVNRWSGDAYYMKAANGQVSPKPFAVISHDPSLAELGRAMRRQLSMSQTMLSRVMKRHLPTLNIDQIMGSGAPISFAGADLQSVNLGPIPKAEFTLPGQPASIDQVRARMNATSALSMTSGTGPKPEVPCHMVLGG